MGQSSSQFPRRALLKNVLAIRQLHSSPMLVAAAAAAKSLQSCPTLCDPRDGSPLGSPIPGILQARTLEWVAISFSNAWKWKVKVKSLSCVRLLATTWTAAYQAPPPMGFSRKEYWIGVPLPSLPMLVMSCLKSCMLVFSIMWTKCPNWVQKRKRNQRSNCQHLLNHRESKEIPEKCLPVFHWLP